MEGVQQGPVLVGTFFTVYFGHFLSFYTMQLEPPKTGAVSTLAQTCLCMGVRAVVTVVPHCIAGQDR